MNYLRNHEMFQDVKIFKGIKLVDDRGIFRKPFFGDDLKEINSVSLIDEFSNLAAKGRSEVRFISTDTEEGAQLDSGFGGLAAVLRYPIM